MEEIILYVLLQWFLQLTKHITLFNLKEEITCNYYDIGNRTYHHYYYYYYFNMVIICMLCHMENIILELLIIQGSSNSLTDLIKCHMESINWQTINHTIKECFCVISSL